MPCAELNHWDWFSKASSNSGVSLLGLFTCRETGCIVHWVGAMDFSILSRMSVSLFPGSSRVVRIGQNDRHPVGNTTRERVGLRDDDGAELRVLAVLPVPSLPESRHGERRPILCRIRSGAFSWVRLPLGGPLS